MMIHEPHAPSFTAASTDTVLSISLMLVEAVWRLTPG
jgi:hypothetical protein